MKIRYVILTALLVVLGGCASYGGFAGPSPEDYAKMNDKQREKAKQKVADLAEGFAAYWEDIAEPLYNSHQFVRVGNKHNGYSLQWLKLPGKYDAVGFYQGHNPPNVGGNLSEAMYLAVANKQGEILYVEGRGGVIAPNKLLTNVSTSEDVRKLFARGGFQIATGAMTGTGAALINKRVGDVDTPAGLILNVEGGEGGDAISDSASSSSGVIDIKDMPMR